MLRLTNRDDSHCARWCALVVLLAICSLTLSVATRYGSTERSSNTATTILHKHFSQEPGRQRLSKNGDHWVPPVVESQVRQFPAPYARIAPTGIASAKLFFVSSLYNRPPPSFKSIL